MSKHISYRSAELLNSVNKQNQKFITVNDAVKILKDGNNSAVRRLLSDMAKRGLIFRLKRGLYNVVPYELETEEFFPDWNLTAKRIVHPEKYYIGFYSALNIHGLITQPSLVEQIVTQKQFIPKTLIIRNVKFEFITYNKEHFFGYDKFWINDYDKVFCSDIEKTIIDCLYKPGYASGIVEIIKVIHKVRETLNQEKLILYLEQFNSQAVLKRLGFILQYLDIFLILRKYLETKISSGYIQFDPSLPKKGKHFSKWKIFDNVGIESALNSIIT
jgi:predicted transcriptional regulator of viral defense system